ncbi:hypothetical protein LIER_24778 [Lithospermum erythrorhizon]|uniref:Uncharacterized protein n=1 Tax=Lithospermum erythrorhizon TaxID=34254 RepID=A0AAV3R4L5_LITER
MPPRRNLAYSFNPGFVAPTHRNTITLREFLFSRNEAMNCDEGCIFVKCGDRLLEFDHEDFLEEFGLMNLAFLLMY